MTYPPEFNSDYIYPNVLNLNQYNVFLDLSGTNPMFIEVNGLPEILTYGKHYGTFSIKEPSDSQYFLKENSQILFEVKDGAGTTVFSSLADSPEIQISYNGAALFYIWIKRDPLNTFADIQNGMGTLTFVGELDGVPIGWQGVPNYRCTFPIEIRKDLPNISPVLFQSSSLIQSKFTSTTTDATHLTTTSSLSESIDLDTGDNNYKRSYLHISASHLQTFGGKVQFVELAYQEQSSIEQEFTVLNTYPLSSSIMSQSFEFNNDPIETYEHAVYEITASSAVGLHPVSDNQKFPLPRQFRRNGTVDFRLRFLNKNMEYVKDLREEDKFVEITSSIL